MLDDVVTTAVRLGVASGVLPLPLALLAVVVIAIVVVVMRRVKLPKLELPAPEPQPAPVSDGGSADDRSLPAAEPTTGEAGGGPTGGEG